MREQNQGQIHLDYCGKDRAKMKGAAGAGAQGSGETRGETGEPKKDTALIYLTILLRSYYSNPSIIFINAKLESFRGTFFFPNQFLL